MHAIWPRWLGAEHRCLTGTWFAAAAGTADALCTATPDSTAAARVADSAVSIRSFRRRARSLVVLTRLLGGCEEGLRTWLISPRGRRNIRVRRGYVGRRYVGMNVRIRL